jgi:hypothetical protein
MRALSPTALAKLQTRLGNEPVVIVEIQWIKDGGWQSYADRDIAGGVKGKILELSDLDDVIAITENNDSQEIQVTFDDTDGSLKDILNYTDIHMRDVRVWQWFEGLDLTDKFLLFCGKINSPIVWNEGEQTLSFSIVSRIEDKEFGFSPEEGQFPYIPVDLIGVPWPSCFGTPLDVPCVAIGQAVHGTTLAGLGILSGSGEPSSTGAVDLSGLAVQQVQAGHCSLVASCWLGVNDNEWQKYESQRASLEEAISQSAQSAQNGASTQAESDAEKIARVNASNLGINPVRILGGQLFPRNRITLNIGGGLFTGYFGNTENVDDDLFTIVSRNHPENLKEYYDEIADPSRVTPGNPGSGAGADFNFYSKVPCGKGDFNDGCNIRTEGSVICTMLFGGGTSGVLPKYFWADAGSAVTLYGSEPITYIVSIVPGTVLSVKAFKTFNGVKHLLNVPDNYYRVETKYYGPIAAVQIIFNKTLSTISDQNWGDDIYVTFESSVGPNIVDILEYIIDTYTEFAVDAPSFDAVRISLEPFPANFAVLERKNVLTILQEIAFQARCSLRLINGIFYLTYLPAEPASVETITESDIEFNSISISGSPTEDLVTKLILEWRITYAEEDLNKLILRHNISYYGLHEETIEFYIYNQPDIILKVGTFWLIRKANTWKYFNCRTFLHKLNVETLDCITLNFEKPYVSDNPTKAIIQKATFNSVDQLIDMECWLPIKFGTMSPYDFAWPADVSSDWIYPTNDDVILGRSGSAWIGEDAIGVLPIGDVEDTSTEQFSSGGGTSVSRGPTRGKDWQPPTYETFSPEADAAARAEAFTYGLKAKAKAKDDWLRERHDTGDRNPSDKDFTAQSVGNTGRSGEIVATTKVEPSKQLLTPNPQAVIPTHIPLPGEGLILDLSLTKIQDYNRSEGAIAYLKDILHFNAAGDKLCLCSDLQIWDVSGADPEKEFDFRYDADGDKWGAGTAWLK